MACDTPAVSAPKIAAVICAAGSSSRYGGTVKKEYRCLPNSDLTVLGAVVSAFAAVPAITVIVIAVPSGSETEARNALPSGLLAAEGGPQVHFVCGGKTRQASVYNALSLLTESNYTGYVLIHDGARPWVSTALIKRIIAGALKYNAVVPLLPLAETPKETEVPLESISFGAETDGMVKPVYIKRHLKRSVTGVAQTPQGFAFPEIFIAHEKAAKQEKLDGREFTDDAELWAAFCGPVAAIPGDPQNRKITFPEDLA